MFQVDGKSYTVGAPSNVLYLVSGASADWAKSIGIKYSYTIELRDTGVYGFELPAEYIDLTAQEAKVAIHVFAQRIANLPQKLLA